MRVYIPLQMHSGLRVSGILFLNMLLPVIVDATRNSLWNANMVAPAEGAASLDSSVSLPLKPAPRGLGSRQRLRMSPIGTADFGRRPLRYESLGQGLLTPPAPAWCAAWPVSDSSLRYLLCSTGGWCRSQSNGWRRSPRFGGAGEARLKYSETFIRAKRDTGGFKGGGRSVFSC